MYMSEEALNCPFYLMFVPEDSHTLGECCVSVLTKSDVPLCMLLINAIHIRCTYIIA